MTKSSPFKPHRTRLIAVLISIYASLLCLNQYSFAGSSVWKISKGKDYFYLGGTVHLLQPSDHPLPKEFDAAYSDADTLIFETDMEATRSPKFQMQLMQALASPDGETLKEALKEETYRALEHHMRSRKLDPNHFAHFSPSGISLMLSLIEYQRMGMKPELGVDTTYEARAANDGKTRIGLESIEEQLSFIRNMSNGEDDKLVIHTLRDLAKIEAYFGVLKQAWLDGDMDQMEKSALFDVQKDYPEIYKILVSNRNNKWMEKIPNLLKSEAREFILVGALHLAGKDGLLQQLEQLGYRVTQLELEPKKKTATKTH